MTIRRPFRLAAVTILSLAVAACTSAGASGSLTPSAPPSAQASPSTAPSTAPSPSGGAATLLLKVATEGGFINPAANLAALPTVAVYTDGRILTPGPVPAIYPGPLLPRVSVRDVGATGAAAILAAIKEIGLDKEASGGPGIPGDSGTNVFTVTVDGVTTVSRFAGGMPGPPVEPGAAGGQVAPGDQQRIAALGLLGKLTDPSETWGAAAIPETPYDPTAYLVFVSPGGPPADPQASQSPVEWPLATPLAAFGTPAVPDFGIAGLRKGAVFGADAAALGPVLQRASVLTPFTSGGSSFMLSVRPLLPDETGG